MGQICVASSEYLNFTYYVHGKYLVYIVSSEVIINLPYWPLKTEIVIKFDSDLILHKFKVMLVYSEKTTNF